MRWLLLAAALGACTRSDRSIDLSTPRAAVQCQTQAIRAKSAAQWFRCMHPDIMALGNITAESLEKQTAKDGFWEEMSRNNAALESVRDADFTEAVPVDSRHVERTARFELPNGDAFVAGRKDGRWYILDTGL